jgi:hypothetical protein
MPVIQTEVSQHQHYSPTGLSSSKDGWPSEAHSSYLLAAGPSHKFQKTKLTLVPYFVSS